jgi:hypothetical protein
MTQEEFQELLEEGTAAEDMFVGWLESKNWNCRKTLPQDKTEPFDYFIMHKERGHMRTIEIKSYGAPHYRTIFAETLQVKSNTVPEYLLYTDHIDYMIYVDQQNRKAFMYKMDEFASYVRANQHKEFTINRGTAKGIKIPECCEAAGYIRTIDL